MFLKTAVAAPFIVIVSIIVGLQFSLPYGMLFSIALSLFLTNLLQYWIVYGVKQGLIELIFSLPLALVPRKLRSWAIWNDNYLDIK